MSMQINSQRNPYASNQRMAFGCRFDREGKLRDLCPKALSVVDKTYDSIVDTYALEKVPAKFRDGMKFAAALKAHRFTKQLIENSRTKFNAESKLTSPEREAAWKEYHDSNLDEIDIQKHANNCTLGNDSMLDEMENDIK